MWNMSFPLVNIKELSADLNRIVTKEKAIDADFLRNNMTHLKAIAQAKTPEELSAIEIKEAENKDQPLLEKIIGLIRINFSIKKLSELLNKTADSINYQQRMALDRCESLLAEDSNQSIRNTIRSLSQKMKLRIQDVTA